MAAQFHFIDVLVLLTVDFVSNESTLVTDVGMQYKRFAVKDNGAPTPTIVDEFVEFIKNKPDDLHLHFHCDAGEGRTTSFMVMYQALKMLVIYH